MIVDCISDLHGYKPTLAGGDLLILAGDYTAADKIPQWCEFFEWLKNQPYRKKILIAGNHDGLFESGFPQNKEEADELREIKKYLNFKEDFEYLCDSGTEFEGLKIWGSPWSLTFEEINPRCASFTGTEEKLSEKWELIPEDIDILITHGPPFGIHDNIPLPTSDGTDWHVGSKSLLKRLLYLKRPITHIFGHIHEGYGQTKVDNIDGDLLMKSINASYVNENYEPVNKPIRISV